MRGIEVINRHSIESNVNGYSIDRNTYIGGTVRYMVSMANGDYIAHGQYLYFMTESEARQFTTNN